MKLSFSIISLTSCSGCISALFSLDILSQFLEKSNILYFPLISDTTNIEDHDIALVEGCISTETQINTILDIRKYAKKVYALGSCAAFGGILSLSKEKKSYPISNYIEIDGIIPGCPPPENILGNCLIRLMENKDFSLPEKTLCFDCPLRNEYPIPTNKKINEFLPDINSFNEKSEPPECFLSKGILCLGPITRGGCDHLCIKQGVPCEGCMGPVAKDQLSNIINFISLYKISNDLKDEKSIFFKFSNPKL